MEILLRKASGLEKAATAAAAKIELETTLRLSTHSLQSVTNFPLLLNEASLALAVKIQDVLDLHEAASSIRAMISIANTKKSGALEKSVNDLLSEQRGLDSAEKVLVQATILPKASRRYGLDENVSLTHDPDAVKVAYHSIVARSTTMVSGSLPNIELPALSPPALLQLEKKLAGVRRRRMDLKDELAYANLQKITLPEKAVLVLRKHDIL